MATGTVKWFNDSTGYGSVTPDAYKRPARAGRAIIEAGCGRVFIAFATAARGLC